MKYWVNFYIKFPIGTPHNNSKCLDIKGTSLCLSLGKRIDTLSSFFLEINDTIVPLFEPDLA